MLCDFLLFKKTFNPKLGTLNFFGGSPSVGLSPISPIFTPCGFNLGTFTSNSKTFGLNLIPCIHSTHFPILEIVYIRSLK